MSELNDLRNKIDEVDLQIVKLLDDRMLICKQVGDYKKANNVPITHSNRENEIIERLSKSSSFTEEEISEIYQIIFKISKSKQK